MKHFGSSKLLRILAALLAAGWAAQPTAGFASVFACAACYGQSDSPLAQGVNWGIFSLLGVVVGVLGAIASFFIYLARKSAAATAQGLSEPITNYQSPITTH